MEGTPDVVEGNYYHSINRSCITPSLTAIKGESFDQSNSTSRENTSTVFDDTFSTKVENSDTFPIIVENSDTFDGKVEKTVLRDA